MRAADDIPNPFDRASAGEEMKQATALRLAVGSMPCPVRSRRCIPVRDAHLWLNLRAPHWLC